jgi:hypothetical protein
MRALAFLCFSVLLICNTPPVKAVELSFTDVNIHGQWFLAHVNESHADGTTFNDFRLKRGYMTFTRSLSECFSVRVTQDISVDKEGDGRGNMEIRLKYGYLRMKLPDMGLLTSPLIEGGMVHRPWLDFEQKVNRYRVQGKMYAERVDVLSSADYGLTFMTLLGGKLDGDTQKKIGKHYPGRLGSLAFGVYNGGGYDAIEENQNKLVEARLSLRPLADKLPGLQAHAVVANGAGNSAASPDFNLLMTSVSWDSRDTRVLASVFTGTGNLSGDALDVNGDSIDRDGWSLFCETKVPMTKNIHVFGRYDILDEGQDADWAERIMNAGLSWDIRPGVLLLFDWEKDEVDGEGRDLSTELALEFVF